MTVVEAADVASVVSSQGAARVHIWLYHPTLRRMMLAVEAPEKREVLYLVCTPLLEIRSAVSWDSKGLRLSESSAYFELSDVDLGWVVRAGGIVAIVGDGLRLPRSPFDGFLGDLT